MHGLLRFAGKMVLSIPSLPVRRTDSKHAAKTSMPTLTRNAVHCLQVLKDLWHSRISSAKRPHNGSPCTRRIFRTFDVSHICPYVPRYSRGGRLRFSLHHVKVFEETGLSPKRYFMSNGGARSTVWRQIVTDIVGEEVEYITDHPGSSLGAAFVAGMGCRSVQILG